MLAATLQRSAVISVLEIRKMKLWEVRIDRRKTAERGGEFCTKCASFPAVLVCGCRGTKRQGHRLLTVQSEESSMRVSWFSKPDLIFRGIMECDKPSLPMLVLWEEHPRTVCGGRGRRGWQEGRKQEHYTFPFLLWIKFSETGPLGTWCLWQDVILTLPYHSTMFMSW